MRFYKKLVKSLPERHAEEYLFELFVAWRSAFDRSIRAEIRAYKVISRIRLLLSDIYRCLDENQLSEIGIKDIVHNYLTENQVLLTKTVLKDMIKDIKRDAALIEKENDIVENTIRFLNTIKQRKGNDYL